MAQKQEKQNPDSPQVGLSEVVNADFLATYGKKAGIALIGVALLISGILFYFKKQSTKEMASTKELGLSIKYLINNHLDSAELALNQFLKDKHDEVSTAKAQLLLGKLFYNQKKYAEALEAYQKITLSESKYSLITSGALHGISACYVQQQQYEKAVESLNQFLQRYQKKNKSNLHNKEIQDLSPAVPNALWKLALCFKQLDKVEKLKETCLKLTEVYGESEESAKAKKLLLTI